MKKNTKNFLTVSLIIVALMWLYNGGYSRTGLADYAQETGLNYDSFLVNTLTSSTSTKPFIINLGGCSGTNTEFTRTLQNDKWTSTAITKTGMTGSSYCVCSDETGTTLPTVSMSDGIMTIAGLPTYQEAQPYSCAEEEHLESAPIYTKFDWVGKDTVIKLKASTPISCSGGNYGVVLLGNVEIPITSTDNLLEIKWSKINPRTFAVFRTGDLIQESTIPLTESVTTCPDYVCGRWTAVKTGCDPTINDKFDFSLAPNIVYQSQELTSTGTIFQASAGKGIFISYVSGTIGTRIYMSGGTKKCTLTTATATYYYADGTSANSGPDYSPCESNYCGLDNYKKRSSSPYVLSNPYIDKLVNKVVLTIGSQEKTSYQGAVCAAVASAFANGAAAITQRPVSLLYRNSGNTRIYPGLSGLVNTQQATCNAQIGGGIIYKDRLCNSEATLEPAYEDSCHTSVENVTTRIGFRPDKKCSVPPCSGCYDNVYSGTLSVEYIRYALPFNCDTESDEVKVFEVFDSGTLTINTPSYELVKFCREFKAEILDEATNAYTIDDSDEIYEALARGETLTIPEGQTWALHYIAKATGRAAELACQESQEFDVAADTCTAAVGFAQRLAILQARVSEQEGTISRLETTISEKADLIQSLNLTIVEQANQIERFDLTISEQAALIDELDLNVQEQAQIINELASNLAEKAALVAQLTSSNERQAELIRQMNLEFSEQGIIISLLNLTVQEDANLINGLSNKVDEQAEIIDAMRLTNDEQAALIISMGITVQNQADLIKNLKLNNFEQGRLIKALNDQARYTNRQLAELIAAMSWTEAENQELVKNLDLSEQEKENLLKLIQQIKLTSPTTIIRIEGITDWFNKTWSTTIGKIGLSAATLLIIYLGYSYYQARWGKRRGGRRRW